MTETQREYNNMLTLLLSWQLARAEGRNEAASIKKTARKLKTQCRQTRFYETYNRIGNARSESQVMQMINLCWQGAKEQGLL
jgi:hypothetical protein